MLLVRFYSPKERGGTVVRCHRIDARPRDGHIPLLGYRATGETQHKRKCQLVSNTGDNDSDDDDAVGSDEAADAEIRGQKRDFEAQQGQCVDRAAGILDLQSISQLCHQVRGEKRTLLNGTTFSSGKYSAFSPRPHRVSI
jgi:hypothetical protein